MFVTSIKFNKLRTYLIFGVTVIILMGSCVIYTLYQNNKETTLPTIKSVSVKNNDDRILFLSEFGWEVNPEPIEIVEVMIPETFTPVYIQYNEIQKSQNMNLEKHRGKTAKRYSYELTNYPNSSSQVRANILVINNKIVGGDICSVNLDGFMHGFHLGS